MQIRPASLLCLLTAVGALLVLGSTAPVASAGVVRYATPAGSGAASCTSLSPCSFAKAVKGAANGDEVIVAPGLYQLTATVETPAQITIRGIAGQGRPRLRFSGLGQDGLRVVHGSTLRYVEVEQAPGTGARGLFAADSALVDQVVARAWDGADTATIQGSTIRNSIAVAAGDTGRALTTATNGGVSASTYRNVTAIGAGAHSIAIQADAGYAGKASVTLVNVIARGFVGLKARTDSSGASATITAIHSNYAVPVEAGTYATIVKLAGNQTLAPTFADWHVGDYRQAPQSVTIGAGLADAGNGTLDVEGDPRNIGMVDIGADERVPAPAATTGAAGAVTDHSATLSGSVDARGGPTRYHFEYGPTTAYGSWTAITDAGTSTAAAGASPRGLKPATTYHYRLVATNSGGVGTGADRTFRTAAAPARGSTSTQAFGGVALGSKRLTYRKVVALRLRCPAGTVGRCSGRTRLTARRRAGSVLLGRARFSIAPGAQAKVGVRVTRAGRRLLGRVRRLRAMDTNAAHDGAGRSKTTVAAVTIRRRASR